MLVVEVVVAVEKVVLGVVDVTELLVEVVVLDAVVVNVSVVGILVLLLVGLVVLLLLVAVTVVVVVVVALLVVVIVVLRVLVLVVENVVKLRVKLVVLMVAVKLVDLVVLVKLVLVKLVLVVVMVKLLPKLLLVLVEVEVSGHPPSAPLRLDVKPPLGHPPRSESSSEEFLVMLPFSDSMSLSLTSQLSLSKFCAPRSGRLITHLSALRRRTVWQRHTHGTADVLRCIALRAVRLRRLLLAAELSRLQAEPHQLPCEDREEHQHQQATGAAHAGSVRMTASSGLPVLRGASSARLHHDLKDLRCAGRCCIREGESAVLAVGQGRSLQAAQKHRGHVRHAPIRVGMGRSRPDPW